MATKKIKNAGEYKIDIKLNSKDTTYVFTNDEAGRGAKLQFYPSGYTNSFASQDDDLFIISNFVDAKKGGYKVILTTIKDYFKYNTDNKDLVTIDEELPDLSNMATYITKESTDTLQGENIVADKGKTNHIIKNVGVEGGTVAHKDYVEDLGGNDTYTITTYHDTHYAKTAEVHITDWAGNDKYNITHNENDGEYSAYFDIADMKGNDEYSISYFMPSRQSTIWEAAGNDKYKLISSTNVLIADENGKDKYNLTGSWGIEINDLDGNDKYEVSGSEDITIYDGNYDTKQGGHDKYTISDSEGLLIEECYGNDKYTLTSVSNEGYDTDYFYVWDGYGKDKYSVTDAHYMNFYDINGNDKWTISKSDNLTVTDSIGNDKWKLSDSTAVEIRDGDGKDKYSVTSSNLKITDSKGKDTYKVSKSEKVTILDNDTQSDDTYKVDNLNGVTVINDKGGAKDKLTISSLKAKDVIYMADFQSNGKGVVDGALYLLDKTKTGYTCIGNYFETKTEEGKKVFDVTQDGDGRIETVKAGKKNITAKIDDFSYTPTLLELSATVAGWLTDYTTFGSVNELLTSGTDEQVQNFIAYIQQ